MKFVGRVALLSGAGVMALCTAAPGWAQDAHSPAAQDPAAQDEDSIIVLGDRLEETTPRELAKYGSRLEIIDGVAIDRGGYSDASQALQMLTPGLYVAPKNGAFDYVSVSLLGSRTADLLFTIDGIRITNRLYAGTTPLDTIPAHMIEQIEVLKGGQGLYYGSQAVAGVVNIVTRDFARELDGALEVGIHTNTGYNVNGYLRGGSGDHYFVAFGSRDQAEGFQPFRDTDYQPSATDRKRGYVMNTGGIKYAFQPSDSFRFSASYQHNEGSVDWAQPEDVAYYRNVRNEELVSVKLDWSPADNFDLYVKGYWHDWDSRVNRTHNVLGTDGLPTGAVTVVADGEYWGFEDKGINVLGEYAFNESFSLVAGYDFQKYNGVDDVLLIAPNSEQVHAPFAQAKFNFGNLSLAAGARHNMPSDGQDKTVWNVSGRFGADRGVYLRGQVGTAFRLPTASELYTNDPCCESGNPNLIGEHTFNVEGGIGFGGPGINAELTGFHRKISDLITISYAEPGFPDGLYINSANVVKVWGGEAVVNAQLSDVFGVTLDYTHTRARQVGVSDQIVNIPKNLAKAILRADSPDRRFGGTLAVNWTGDVYSSVATFGRIEHGNYAVVDLSAYLFLDEDRRHRVGVRVENLLNTDYASRVSRFREDITDASYAVDNLGTPFTVHASYRVSL